MGRAAYAASETDVPADVDGAEFAAYCCSAFIRSVRNIRPFDMESEAFVAELLLLDESSESLALDNAVELELETA